MATKKDLVEAYAFSRRRLVTAFVSGAPGGREVEPARPGRMIIGGIALSVLLVAGAAVAGALTGKASVDFDKPGLVTDDSGALYIILQDDDSRGEPVLRPVINVTSARLILGDDGKVNKVDDEELAAEKKGPAVGILDAPAIVPPADDLVNSGWISCTATAAGVRTEVVAEPEVERRPTIGVVVQARSSKKRYLIAEATDPEHPLRAYRYLLPKKSDGLLDALGSLPATEISVPDEWLALFPEGGALTPDGLGIDDWGEPIGVPGYPKGTRVGDIDDSRTSPYVITREGPVQLTPFAEAVVRSTSLGPRAPERVTPSIDLDVVGEIPYADSQWPRELLSAPADPTDQVCGVLETKEGVQPAVRIATFPAGSAMLDDVDADERDVRVEPGYGALVRSGGWSKSSGGTSYLIDDGGRSYSLAGDLEVENLGYGGVDEVVVPDAWIRLFRPGPDLSRLAALCPPRASDPDEKATAGESC